MFGTAYVLHRDFFQKGNEQELKDELGETDFWNFKYLIENILSTSECSTLRANKDHLGWNVLRKNTIYENFKKVYEHFSDGKFYGKWGQEHTFSTGVATQVCDENFQRFATQLDKNDDSPVKGKVCAMAIYYIDSYYMDKKTGDSCPIYNPCSNDKKECDTLESFADSNITLFQLDKNDSPFRTELYFLYPQSVPRVISDFFQYIITVKDSIACTLY